MTENHTRTLEADSADLDFLARTIMRSFGTDFPLGMDPINNVGQLHDYIILSYPQNNYTGSSCFTAIAYYRLRRALSKSFDKRSLIPSSNIENMLPTNANGKKEFWSNLEKNAGLLLPELRIHSGRFFFWGDLVPPICSLTLGGLARYAAVLNFRKLSIETNTFREADVWRSLMWLINDIFPEKGELVTRETLFS
jgi:hypothetical protein